jgi:hypothetical protein
MFQDNIPLTLGLVLESSIWFLFAWTLFFGLLFLVDATYYWIVKHYFEIHREKHGLSSLFSCFKIWSSFVLMWVLYTTYTILPYFLRDIFGYVLLLLFVYKIFIFDLFLILSAIRLHTIQKLIKPVKKALEYIQLFN